jgi:hypothetical protein
MALSRIKIEGARRGHFEHPVLRRRFGLSRLRLNAGFAFVFLIAIGLASAPSVRAQQLYMGSSSGLPEQVDRMYVKGMDFLAHTQLPAGNWPDQSQATEPAITGLAIVSLLAHGDDPNFGPYSATVHRAIDYILKKQDSENGYIGPSMYNHGFATLALAESYGAVDDNRIGVALQKAVKLIVGAQQQNNFKAWRYSPESRDADTTVSGAQMVALMAARNAGIPVPEKTVQDGLKFFLSCQTAEGGMGYISPVAPNATRTAIACLVMALTKEKNTPAFKAAFQFLKESTPDAQYPQYFKYYASQAFFQGSSESWQTWNHDNIAALRTSQTPDGNWDGQFGPTFNTAACLLSLALNYRYLPIYER